MDMSFIFEIVKLLGYVVLGGLVICFKTNEKLKTAAQEAIAEAEKEYKNAINVSGDKLQFAITYVYDKFPPMVQFLVPRIFVKNIIENALIKFQEYARQGLEKAAEKILN